MESDCLLIAFKLLAEAVEDDPTLQLYVPSLTRLLKEAAESVEHDDCIVCRLAGVSQVDVVVEQHHVAGKVLGKANFPDTVPLCKVCHEYQCDHQRAWLLCRRDKRTRLSCYFFGWADVFDLISNKSELACYRRLASKFRAQAWHIRNDRNQKHSGS